MVVRNSLQANDWSAADYFTDAVVYPVMHCSILLSSKQFALPSIYAEKYPTPAISTRKTWIHPVTGGPVSRLLLMCGLVLWPCFGFGQENEGASLPDSGESVSAASTAA